MSNAPWTTPETVLVRNPDARMLTPDEINASSMRKLYDYILEAGSEKLKEELQFHRFDFDFLLANNDKAFFQNGALKVEKERACAGAIVNVKLAATTYELDAMPSANHANDGTVNLSQWLPSGRSCGVHEIRPSVDTD
jgi:hypothetical protein